MAVTSAQVAVTVGDDGPGLPAEVRARVFEPFVSTRADGLGVGLGICRTIAEAHGGTMAALDAAEGLRGVPALRAGVRRLREGE